MPPNRVVLVLALATVAVGLAGCLSDDGSQATEPVAPTASEANATSAIRSFPTTDGPNATPPADAQASNASELRFGEPVELTDGEYAFEPSIETGPSGTLFITAAYRPSVEQAGYEAHVLGGHSSLLWYSEDGHEWSSLPSPAQAHEAQSGFEGDLAVDGEGRLYFVDTYLADNTLSRWSTGDEGPSWDFSRPVQGTAGVDDRPWLAAHGDGIVYYAGNNGAMTPTPGNLANGEDPSRIWLSVSEDGGRTWELRRGFPSSEFCVPAASPADDGMVVVTCTHVAEGTHVVENPQFVETYSAKVHVSTDRGRTWTSTTLRGIEDEPAWYFPSTAVDEAGTPFASWGEGNGPARLFTARKTADAWQVMDVTPFEGTFNRTWIAAGGEGRVALVFYGTHDTDPGPETPWHPYALVSEDATAEEPVWRLSRITEEPVAEGAQPPYDFFQATFGPEGRLHVAYGSYGASQNVHYAGSLPTGAS